MDILNREERIDILNRERNIDPEIYKTEIRKLAKGLEERNIPYELKPLFDGWQIWCDDWDAICHSFSYGHEKGLLEIMGTLVDEEEVGDTVEGHLTAEEILRRIDGA